MERDAASLRRIYWDEPRRELTEAEIEEVRHVLDAGWHGPVVETWVRRLLIDHEMRVERELATGR